MSGYSTKREITFDCGHKWHFSSPWPKLGDTLWCMSCRRERRVISAPDEWKIRCTNCTYNRGFGAAKINSEIAIGKHRRNHPGHIVKQFNGRELVRIFGTQDVQQQTELF